MRNANVNRVNPFLFPIANFYYIGINAINGFIFVFFRIPVILYEMISFKMDKTYRKFKGENMKPSLNVRVFSTQPKKKVYKYSNSYLKKMATLKENLKKEIEAEAGARSKEPIIYSFKGMDADGKITTGTMYGYSKGDLNTFLINDGYEVYSIKTSKYIETFYGTTSIFGISMSIKDLLFWLTQLSTYLKAGITLSEAIKILANQMGKKDKNKQRIFKAISYELSLGNNFSSALEKQGNMFPGLLINMIKAAEATGSLEETLDDMADYYTEIDKTRKQMVSAMTYPILISIFATAVIIFIMVSIIPQFVDIYQSSGIPLNGLTAFIINVSKFLSKHLIVIILVFIGIIILNIALYKKVRTFRAVVQTILMRLPVISKVIIYNEITIFTKTFASLLKNNVFITDSMDILMKITNNEVYKNIMYDTINNIIKGDKISDSFKDNWAIPDVAYYMIVTGESTGKLDEMMQKVSDYYQEMHRNIITTLKAFIEPIMITCLAFVVGIIIISVMVPMFGMYEIV